MTEDSALGLAGETVLVVDDDRSMRETLIDILELHGVRAIGAGSAATALADGAGAGAAVALVDQRLPDSSGIELCAALKSADQDLQVIMLTGYATVENAIAAVGRADEFLTKPVDPDELLRTLKTAIDRRRLRRENAELVARLRDVNAQLEASVGERTSDLNGLVAMAEAVARAQDLGEVADAVVRTAADATRASAAAVYLLDDASTNMRLQIAWSSDQQWPTTLLDPADAGAEQLVRVPLVVAGTTVGALVVVDPERSSDSYLTTLAIEAAVALQNAQRLAREHETVDRLSELSRLKSTFLASASHELRTPLTAVVGFAQTLARQRSRLSDADQQHLLDRMVVQGERLGALINNLLDSTALESGHLRVHLQPVDALSIMKRVAEAFGERPQTIKVDVADALPLVQADDGRLEQILINLVDNATKYSPPEAQVTMGADAESTTVTLWVRDEGPGIDASFLDQAFDPFTQADSGDDRRHPGVGLGLYIVRGLVDAMGGRVGVDSQPGEGACIQVELPRAG